MSTLFAAVCLRGNSGMHKAEIIRRRCLESLMRHVNKVEVLHYDSLCLTTRSPVVQMHGSVYTVINILIKCALPLDQNKK